MHTDCIYISNSANLSKDYAPLLRFTRFIQEAHKEHNTVEPPITDPPTSGHTYL